MVPRTLKQHTQILFTVRRLSEEFVLASEAVDENSPALELTSRALPYNITIHKSQETKKHFRWTVKKGNSGKQNYSHSLW